MSSDKKTQLVTLDEPIFVPGIAHPVLVLETELTGTMKDELDDAQVLTFLTTSVTWTDTHGRYVMQSCEVIVEVPFENVRAIAWRSFDADAPAKPAKKGQPS